MINLTVQECRAAPQRLRTASNHNAARQQRSKKKHANNNCINQNSKSVARLAGKSAQKVQYDTQKNH